MLADIAAFDLGLVVAFAAIVPPSGVVVPQRNQQVSTGHLSDVANWLILLVGA
jgi:hypothetical protein